MRLSVLQENLAQGLNIASRSVATRAQLPILSNVLLTTDKGRLKISATNLETGINLWVGAKIEKEGSLSVPAKILSEFVSSLPAGKIELEAKENSLSLSAGAFKADFIGLSAAEFPLVPSLTGKVNVSFEGKVLASAVSQVAFAAATDEGRPVLTGVLILPKGNQLVLAATDGYRLSMKKLKEVKGLEKLAQSKSGLIIPSRTLIEVARLVGEADEEKIKLAITPKASQVIFALGEAEIVSRLIEGKFPDFEKIIPESSTTKVTVETETLTRAVRMAAIFARESANIIRFEIKGAKLRVSANTAQVGGNISEVEAKVEGKEGKVAFNSRYLLDFLNTISADQVSFEMSGALNPGVFTALGDKSFLHIIMPVRVQE